VFITIIKGNYNPGVFTVKGSKNLHKKPVIEKNKKKELDNKNQLTDT